LYGYDFTDIVLDRVLERSACDYFLFTNGDNLYSRYFFSAASSHMKDGIDLIAVDFACHHAGNHLRQVLFYNSGIDLGAALVSRRSIDATGARFLRGQVNATTRAYYADWLFFAALLADNATSTALIRQILFMHL
jgi:hypothetical protein